MLPTLKRLARLGVLPSHLVEVAIKGADPSWLKEPEHVDERIAQAREYVDLLVTSFPRDVWSDETGDWERLGGPTDIDDLDDDDVEALEMLVLRQRTAAMTTALSESALGLTDDIGLGPDEDQEDLPSWAGFRRGRREHADGQDVGAVRPDAESDPEGAR